MLISYQPTKIIIFAPDSSFFILHFSFPRMARFFLELSYNGTRFCGYQRQPNGSSVQETIENALTTLLKEPTEIVGCGRTDAGVHAQQYFAHFDAPDSADWQNPDRHHQLLLSLNALVGYDIAINKIHTVADDAHARFDATARTYHYHFDLQKNPFRRETAAFVPYIQRVDFDLLQAAAKILLDYSDFQTFCKTETDVNNYICRLSQSSWRIDPTNQQFIYTITANRFLRGMVRLIVGMCLHVATRKISTDELIHALNHQLPLKKAYSAPAQGLFLTDIRYPYIP
jgi:tRNA pseudouridine38-40 synthase